MATKIQRAIAILDAVVDGTSTNAQRQRAVAAFGDAEGFLAEVTQFVKRRILASESQAAYQALPPIPETGL